MRAKGNRHARRCHPPFEGKAHKAGHRRVESTTPSRRCRLLAAANHTATHPPPQATTGEPPDRRPHTGTGQHRRRSQPWPRWPARVPTPSPRRIKTGTRAAPWATWSAASAGWRHRLRRGHRRHPRSRPPPATTVPARNLPTIRRHQTTSIHPRLGRRTLKTDQPPARGCRQFFSSTWCNVYVQDTMTQGPG